MHSLLLVYFRHCQHTGQAQKGHEHSVASYDHVALLVTASIRFALSTFVNVENLDIIRPVICSV